MNKRITELKSELRHLGCQARNVQPDKEQVSKIICDKFVNQRNYQQAETVMWYLHCRSEVRTIDAVSMALTEEKRVVIPYCTKDEEGNNKLGLWRLTDWSELEVGTWGVLEPPKERWGEHGKEVFPKELDLVMVPGVGFDSQGGRIGHGAGYYDYLLNSVRPDTVLSAVCYGSQIFDEIPMEDHDVYMDVVITEKNTYTCNGRNRISK